MLANLLIFVSALTLVIQGATLATSYSVRLSKNFRLSKHVVSFIVVTFVAILPEAVIVINSALKGVPEFGLGTLFGSNIADLTLVFAILIFFAGRNLKIKSELLRDVKLYPLFLLLPLLFGLNGNYTRLEGVILIIVGLIFYYFIFKNGAEKIEDLGEREAKLKNIAFFLLSMVLLFTGSHFVVVSAVNLANFLQIPAILIGIFIVGLGTILPELFYSLKSVQKKDDDLAVGNLLGTVLANATIVVGVLAVLHPFSFPSKIIYVTGAFMLAASVFLMSFMHSGKILTKREGFILLGFWILYVLAEFFVNSI